MDTPLRVSLWLDDEDRAQRGVVTRLHEPLLQLQRAQLRGLCEDALVVQPAAVGIECAQ
jgi:hypothetical protein